MKTRLNQYRLAGAAGGLLLAAGQFVGYLCILQLFALLPVMILAIRDRRPRPAALAGLYMGIACMVPQIIYLRMPVPVTALLIVWITILLIALCLSVAIFLPHGPILGPAAVGAAWLILDWINYTAVPVWGMAQSFARSWTAYPFAIQFISITGISGVLFVIGILQGLWAYAIVMFARLHRRPPSADSVEPWGQYLKIGTAEALIILLLAGADTVIWLQKPTGSLKVAASGWVFDDRSAEIDPHKAEGFETLFAAPAREAAAQGSRIFTTGELGFYIARHEWDHWMNRFSAVAQENDLWLVVGYFNIDIDENRLFFMSPEGVIVQEYTKTHLTPFEPGHKGNGDLKTIQVDGLTVGAMICQDDNFSKRTRHYGNLTADIVLCPTADWWTIKDAHLQAVRARAIECRYPIVRGAANGISAAISARGQILARHDHYDDGPGYIIADIPVYESRTFFSRFGHAPSLIAAGMCLGAMALRLRKEKRRRWHSGV